MFKTTTSETTTSETEASETQTARRPRRSINVTLAICLTGGIAAGIALARPGSSGPAPAPPVAAAEPAVGAPTVPDEAGGDPAPGATTSDPVTPPGEVADAVPAGPAASIEISDFAFGEPVTVPAGATFTVTNRDGAPHTLTASDGSFDTGNLNQGDAVVITAPATPGTYSFFCAIHPSMTGQLNVT